MAADCSDCEDKDQTIERLEREKADLEVRVHELEDAVNTAQQHADKAENILRKVQP